MASLDRHRSTILSQSNTPMTPVEDSLDTSSGVDDRGAYLSQLGVIPIKLDRNLIPVSPHLIQYHLRMVVAFIPQQDQLNWSLYFLCLLLISPKTHKNVYPKINTGRLNHHHPRQDSELLLRTDISGLLVLRYSKNGRQTDLVYCCTFL